MSSLLRRAAGFRCALMSYAIADIEVTQPLPTVALGAGDTGVAVVVRRKGRPVGFVLQSLPAGSQLRPTDLDHLVARSCATRLLEEVVLEELGGVSRQAELRLTVAICTRNRPESLQACLRSVLEIPGRKGGERSSFEILVVDNAPSDERTAQLVDDFSGVRYVREPRPGLDFARNRAIREATGDVLAFIDDDVVVDVGWLVGLQEAWAEHPDACAVTGLVLPFELVTGTQVTFERRGGFRRGFDKRRYAGPTVIGDRLYPYGAGIFGAGCNMAFRRDVLLEIGGFDEALDTGPPLPGGGDLDIFHRVARAGYPLVYEPRCLVFHKHRREHEALRRQYWSWGTGFMAYLVKCYRSDASDHLAISQLMSWWFRTTTGELVRSLRGRSELAPDLVMAELTGGVVGLAGTYSRSLKRSERIRREFQ